MFFYSDLINDPDNMGVSGIGFILNWLYLIFFLSLLVTCIFSVIHFFFNWKRNPKSIRQPVIGISALAVLLACTYALGNGNPLSIPGYEGKENSSFWLKLTDMWLYSLYILLALAVITLFGGIIWSYIKKTN